MDPAGVVKMLQHLYLYPLGKTKQTFHLNRNEIKEARLEDVDVN